MKAILQTKYGSPEVLQLTEVEKPTPTENQVLVKVHAASVNALEWRPFTMSPIFIRLMGGLLKPKDPKLGTDIAGRVEAVGSNVTEFQPGDEVFGVAPGAFAEYVCAGETKLALKPANVSFEAAAAVPVAASPLCRVFATKDRFSQGKRFSLMGRLAAWVHLPCRLPKPSGRK